MKILYARCTEAAAKAIVDQHADAFAEGARFLRDDVEARTRRDVMCDLVGEGDEVIAPSARHLDDTPEGVLAFVRRVAHRGARLRLEREGLDGETLLRAFDVLTSLRSAPMAETVEPVRRRGGRKSTIGQERIDEVVRMSRNGARVVDICMRTGLSSGSVVRIRRRHRAAWDRSTQQQSWVN